MHQEKGLSELAKNPELQQSLDAAELFANGQADVKKMSDVELQKILTLLRGFDESQDKNKDIRKRISNEIKSTPETEQGAVMFTQLADLLANAQGSMPELAEIMNSKNPEEALQAMKSVLQDKLKAKIMVNVFGRLTKFFKNGLSKLKNIQAFEKKFNVEGMHSIVGKMTPETMQFLVALAKADLAPVDILQFSPTLIHILKDPNYLIFTESAPTPAIIQPSAAPSNPDEPPAVGTSLTLGSLESDLVIMYSSNEKLFAAVINAMNEPYVHAAKPDTDRFFGLTHAQFIAKRDSLIALGQALKAAVMAAKQAKSETTPPPRNRENDDEHDPKNTEQIARIQAEIAQNELAQKPYVEKYAKDPLEPEELKTLRDLQLQHSRLSYDLNRLSHDVSYIREESNPLVPSETKLMRLVATEFAKDLRSFSSIEDTTGSLTEAQKLDRRMFILAERFLRNGSDLTSFLNNYYAETYAEEREKMVALMRTEFAAKGSVLDEVRDIAEIDRRTALQTREVTELMLQTIVIKMYTNTIEAGGEPNEPFAAAVRRAKSSLGYDAKGLVMVVEKALTGYKTEAARLKNTQHMGPLVNYASPLHEVYDEKSSKAGVRMTSMNQRIDHKYGSDGEAIKVFTNSLERQFETFERAIEGHYMLRFWTNAADGKYYNHLLSEGSEYIKSDTFDVIHLMKDGDVVAKYLPALKSIMDDFFAQYGWVIGMKLEADPTGHQTTLFTIFKEYLEKYYPELSDMQQRKFAYLAFHQAYSHGYFQQMLSRSRTTAGYQGKLFDRANALHNIHYNGYMFAYSKPDDLVTNKHWVRGSRVLPAWYTDMVKMNLKADPTGRVENLSETVPYGALIEFGTNEFGHFLTHTNEHFDGTITKSMMPYNFFDTGSDDNYRGWRQVNKAIGNLSTSLWERAPYQDEVRASKSYGGADQYTLIWKSVENVGANYVRTFMESMVKVQFDGEGNLKNSAKLQHLFQFLYRRYLSDGVGKHLIDSDPALARATNDVDFWNKLSTLLHSNKENASRITNDVLYRVYTVMMAERNPMTLVNKVTRWTTQTGSTLFDEVREDFASLSDNEYAEIRRDIITVQTEARARVTDHIMKHRHAWERDWEKRGLNRNIFGDFSQDRSSVSITGAADDRGYVVNERTIETLLRARLEKNASLTPEQVNARVANAKKLYKNAMTKFVTNVNLPEYEKLESYFKTNANSAYGDFFDKNDGLNQTDATVAPIIKQIRADNPGASDDRVKELFGEYLFRARVGGTKAEYEAKYKKGLTSHANWWVNLWQNRYFGMEPESDFSEALTTYRNSDENHLKRMADMTESTSVYIKGFLDNPDDEKSLETAVKDFSKDPKGTIDNFSKFLNPFRKILENQLGKDQGVRFVNYYTTVAIDATLKEDHYRAGFSGRGFLGIYRDVFDLIWSGPRKMSLGAERYQYWTGKSMTAMDSSTIARYLVEKKLANLESAEKLKARIHGTIPDIMYEAAPFLVIFLILSMANEMYDKIKDELQIDDKKKK